MKTKNTEEIDWTDMPTYHLHRSGRTRNCSACGRKIPKGNLHYLTRNQVCPDHFHSIPLCLSCARRNDSWRRLSPRLFTYLRLENGLPAKMLYLGDPAISSVAKACKTDIKADGFTARGITGKSQGEHWVLEVNLLGEPIYLVYFHGRRRAYPFDEFPSLDELLELSAHHLEDVFAQTHMIVYRERAYPATFGAIGYLLKSAIKQKTQPAITVLLNL